MRLRQAISLVAMGAALGAWGFRPRAAHAVYETRLHASGCTSTPGGLAVAGEPSIGNAGTFCPVNDDTAHPKSTINTVNLHGHAEWYVGAHVGTQYAITAKVCARYYGAVGGTCSAAQTHTTPNAEYTLSFSTATHFSGSGWGSSADFGYVLINDSATRPVDSISTFRGVYTWSSL